MKNYKKLILLLIAICICFSLFFIVQIYAKYLTSAEGSTALTIANWNISVNNLSIKNNDNISQSIVPVFPGNEHIASNIIAPTAEGYFDLNFDFSNADVSFKYEINTSAAENSSVVDLVATGYSIDDGDKIEFENFNEPITEIIKLSSNIQNRKIRVYITWNDNEETQSMSNSDDSLSTTSENPALFDVNVSFTQVTETQQDESITDENITDESITT